MMVARTGIEVFGVFVLIMLCGCASGDSYNLGKVPTGKRPVASAVRADVAIIPDGKLKEAVWDNAPRHELAVPTERALEEPDAKWWPGQVQFAWDDRYFYVAVTFEDDDIRAEGDEDQLHHYTMGDVCEVFMKPADHTWYWEMYVTPKGHKTLFWYTGPGAARLPSSFEQGPASLRVGAEVDGTINEWRDRDRGWTAEMAVPIEMLTERGEKFGPGHEWYIFIGRYNYSRYREYRNAQLSGFPELPEPSFHLWKHYARLECIK